MGWREQTGIFLFVYVSCLCMSFCLLLFFLFCLDKSDFGTDLYVSTSEGALLLRAQVLPPLRSTGPRCSFTKTQTRGAIPLFQETQSSTLRLAAAQDSAAFRAQGTLTQVWETESTLSGCSQRQNLPVNS